jgi:DNA helicase-2/ATP-dependent DNA helicase PcrA
MDKPRDGADRAISAPLKDTHIQIIACAGSGKTETLALRVAHLLAQGVEPESIVAFTFTEKAAAELKQRILDRSKQKCGESILGRVGRMYVGTIHAYALRLLQAYAPRYAGYDLIEEDALRAWVARHSYAILGTRSWSGLWDRIGTFLHDADMVENEGLWPAGSDDFSKKYRTFVETLDSHRLLTFGRSIAAAVEELRSEDVKRNVHNDIRFVFIDEYQDVNPAQEQLVRGLVGRNTQLCVVGDDDQSIYQWRGSDVAIMQGFSDRYRPVLRVELGINRRSVPSIVSVAADFAKTIKPRLAKSIGECRTETKNARPVRILAPLNRQQEAEDIASAIEALMKAGWHAGQIAILVRRWRQVDPILQELQARNIRYDCGGGTSLFATPLGYLLAAGFVIGAGWKVPYGWKRSHLPQPPTSEAQWAQQIAGLLRLSKAQQAAAKAWIKAFSQEAQGDGTRPASLVGDLYDLADAIGVGSWNLDGEDEYLWFGTFSRFSQVLASFEKARLSGRWVQNGDAQQFRGGQDRGAWFYQGLAHFLNGHALDTSGGFETPPDPGSPAVQITTIHSAKGLQWPIVFLPGLEDGKFPSNKIGQAGTTEAPSRLIPKKVLSRYAGTEADERRLFYVGMTRARDLLVVSCPERANTNRVSPSAFFEFVQDHSKAWMPPEGFGSIPSPSASDAFHPPLPSLTFSELSLYGNCPYAYRLSTEFDVATPIARDLGYGKSIHHILRRVADVVKSTGKIPDGRQVESLFNSEFHVPYTTAAGHAEMKVAAQKLVDRYIKDWSDDLKCVWEVERPFELHLDSVIIVGRADVILDREQASTPKLTIVDYKTYEAKKADQPAEDQLRTYTAAARAEGFEVSGAILHNLKNAARHEVAVDSASIEAALARASSWAAGITKGEYPAKPEKKKCLGCDYKRVCQHKTLSGSVRR